MLSVMWDNGPQTHWGPDTDLCRSRDVIGHVTIRLPMPNFLLLLHCIQTLSPAIFEILGRNDNGVTTLTFIGHVTSSTLIPPYILFPIRPPLWRSSYLQPFSKYWAPKIIGSRPWPFKVTWRHRSRDHWTPIPYFLFVFHCDQAPICTPFRHIGPQR